MLFSWAAWRPPFLEGADRKRDVPDLFPTCRDKLECITCVPGGFSVPSLLRLSFSCRPFTVFISKLTAEWLFAISGVGV